MSAWSARQLAGLGAVVATVLFIVGFVVPGQPPDFDADRGKIIRYFHSHHDRINRLRFISLSRTTGRPRSFPNRGECTPS